jgi:23S rRNA pseudouridine1911/1915/1917 synthase
VADRRSLPIDEALAGLRLDVAVARALPELSRARASALIEDGRILVDGRPAKPATRLHAGGCVTVEIPPPEPSGLVAQDLPLTVLREDASLLVLDKAAGMVVHPARGTPHSTVVNALLHRLGQARGAGEAGDPGARLGLVHRLDKETSGCLVVAKTARALASLQAQFKGRTVGKTYLALCHGALPETGRLDTPYGRHPRERTRYTSRGGARRAVTEWRVLERFGDAATLAEVTLHTGRTHQIRVHLSEAGHPLLADELYGGRRRESRLPPEHPARRAAEALGRHGLHAWRLAFDHPETGARIACEAPVPPDLDAAIGILREGAAVPLDAAPRKAPAVSRRTRPRARGRS